MCRSVFLSVMVSVAIAGAVQAQSLQRRASFLGGGSPDRGKCTVEVVVDAAAEVEIRGDTANLRTIAGQPAQWRRFECTGPLPANPAEFRFAGVDGRGRQNLVRDPRNGGPAVIRIEDTQGGSEGYTFDIFWGGGYSQGPGPGPGGDRGYDRGPGRRFTTEQAIEVCESSIRDQAGRRFRTNNINFGRVALDDNPGRQDWVMGMFDVGRPGREETYSFSCSVNFDNGRVRTADIGARVRR
jgi:hypothetical protein